MERIRHIIETWFLKEPALFQVLCTHEIVPNTQMACAIRSGRLRVEYNPLFTDQMSDIGLEDALKTEAIRILLKHPYQRKPDGCSQQAVSVGSDIVIGDNYNKFRYNIDTPADYKLPSKMNYEWYARKIQEMLPQENNGGGCSQGGGGNKRLEQNAARDRDTSELWDEDDMALVMINGIIESCQEWGSLAGSMAEKLKASTRAKINWRNAFSGFRASILSSKRKLTRMKPNRRTGFQNMGSIRKFNTRLLVAVDVSGSISSTNLSHFYGVINSAFRYGFETIDVIQFDHGVRTLQSLKKAIKDVVAVGRGGTSFTEPIEYAHENGYDGLVILTDGYAPQPRIPDNMRCKIIWVCQDSYSYENHHRWMEKSGRVCTMELK